MRRPMKICGLLLWAATPVFGLSMSLNCTNFTDRETLLEPYRRCNVTVEHGYLHALCNISFGLQVHENLIRLEPETITVERHLVSDEPVDENTPEGGIICLSLHSITLRKWSNFPPVIGQQNDYSLTVNYTQSGLFHFNYLLVQIRQLTYKATFGEPAQAAIAICNGTRADRICKFDVYGFVEHNTRNSTDPEFQLDNVMRMLFMNWNIGSLTYEVMNITFRQSVKHIPLYLSLPLSMTPIRHIVFYKCNFHNITSREIPSFPNLERLEFFQTPIEEIHAVAFFRNPGLRHASFIGTKLSGIPEGIFNLTRLVTLDISDTDVPRNIKFEFCPLSCECNSTAQLLVMSRSRLDSLPDQAFCGFPLLKQLELENCHITNISGSPFECLENLSNLSLSDNKIRSLSGEAMKGLKNLSFLNLSKNRIVRFEGPRIFSTLPSLRMLILSQNEVKELELEVVKYVPIEELNLEHNQISKWKPPVFTNMRKLKTLHLEHNLLSRISDDMLSDISHVSYVNLGYNSWDCSSCQHKNLLSVLEKHPAYCSDCFVCKEQDDHEGRLVVDVPWNMTACTPPDPYIVYGVPALLSILCASLIAYAVHRYRWYCMYGLLYLKVSVKGFRRHKQAGNFLWDGFLSYHASDAEWVRDVLVPKLESAPMNFRLCVSERDFIPGLPITENICRAITQSRVSLFVLSREFCRSRWCMFELSLAQHRLFENDRHDGMVFIRKNDLEEYEMSPMMKYLMKTRTYVQLPPDGSSEALNNLFWLQVQAALQQ